MKLKWTKQRNIDWTSTDIGMARDEGKDGRRKGRGMKNREGRGMDEGWSQRDLTRKRGKN